MKFDYDLFVIGGGSGGLAASKRAASYGARVGLAEFHDLGGTCVNRGCIPKKLMVYASHFPELNRDALGYGWSKVESQLDWQQMLATVNKEVARLSQVHMQLLSKFGVELFRGYAKFLDPHTLDIEGRKVTADKILIAVGGRPVRPDLPGSEHIIVSDDMFHLPVQPKHIVILGAGYIGVEFACIMNGLGTQVTELVRGAGILKGFDEDIRTGVYTGMTQHGVHIINNVTGKKFEQVPDGIKVTFTERGKDTDTTITADVVLAAIGRLPNLEKLGLENAGVNVVPGEQQEVSSSGYSLERAIAVDQYSRTSQPNIFAVGDCTDRINLTPVAIAEGRAFADTEFGNTPHIMSHSNVPSAVFSQPEAATVGLTETQAREKLGDAVKCYRAQFRPLFHSLTGREHEKTIMKLVVDDSTDRVLGAHMVGENAGEIIQGVAIAVNMGATKKDFDATVGIHPSSAEEFVTMR